MKSRFTRACPNCGDDVIALTIVQKAVSGRSVNCPSCNSPIGVSLRAGFGEALLVMLVLYAIFAPLLIFAGVWAAIILTVTLLPVIQLAYLSIVRLHSRAPGHANRCEN